jgi:hypothetical protein
MTQLQRIAISPEQFQAGQIVLTQEQLFSASIAIA